ncbi:hypothetical protein HID58_020523 [Brassica napus]|uniref:Uncharacterized protein n=1 Tax=Brassica napus TaxID=3708 RepID=A0ABQ7XIX6_BRANA|nr:hypothetical protein HID58_020523 [Brassica napus]
MIFVTKIDKSTRVSEKKRVICVTLKGSASSGAPFEVKSLAKASSSVGFTVNAFGNRFVIPASAPGWVYFCLLMAAGFGLFISEEALNIWVGITLARMLTLDGTWQSFAESFSRNAPYIMSTVSWVYWGVCISDMIPFYLGKLFRQSGSSDDVCSKSKENPGRRFFRYRPCFKWVGKANSEELALLADKQARSKLGIGKEKAMGITQAVQKYGNLSGFVRNPTAFFAGALGISPECFFAGVCCGGLITLPIQLVIGFLLRERPMFAVTTVATVVGIWTIFPYMVAAATALYLYIRSRYTPKT